MPSTSTAALQTSSTASFQRFPPRRPRTAVRSLPRVLLAEDDGELRGLLAGVLRRDRHEVIEARDGTEMLTSLGTDVLRSIGRSRIDLIISDLRMPGASGLSVLAGLRHSDWSTPFVLITAFGAPAVLEVARRTGATVILSKPFDLQEFRTTVLDLTFPCALEDGVRPRCFLCDGSHHTRPDERSPGRYVCLGCAAADLTLSAIGLDGCSACGCWHQVRRDERQLGQYACLECNRSAGDIATLYRDHGGQG